MLPDFSFELVARGLGHSLICGIDEAGRGPWAGPVVAAAVVLDPQNIPRGLNDSKKLNEATREMLFNEIMSSAKVGVGIADERRIDRFGVSVGQPVEAGNADKHAERFAERQVVGESHQRPQRQAVGDALDQRRQGGALALQAVHVRLHRRQRKITE